MCTQIMKKIFTMALLAVSAEVSGQTIGNWNSSTAQTSTNSAVGVGTMNPRAWQEIEYCQNTQMGLIVSKDRNCAQGAGVGSSSSSIIWDQMIQPMIISNGDESLAKFIPINFRFYPVLTDPTNPYAGMGGLGLPKNSIGQPLIWARELDPSLPGGIGTRFIVTPEGRIGVNMPSPRAALDVRAAYEMNVPIAIFGVSNGNDYTRHLHLTANLGGGAYNSISQNGDFGMFYTDGNGPTDGSNVNGALVIAPWNADPNVSGLRMDARGNVGIGTPMLNNPNDYKLGVNGLIICKELVVDIEDVIWPDYVFDSTYSLLSIDSLRTYVSINKHLPQVQSAKEINSNGEVKVSEMQLLLLRKLEELTLYIIQLDNKNKALEAKLNEK